MGKYKHGDSVGIGTKEYRAWCKIKERCHRRKHKFYHRYGGRGITVCERWNDSYANFLKDMGRAPTIKHSIDRIDNDGNYEPSNVRWATWAQQRRNSSSRLRIITFNGETKCARDWERQYGLTRGVIRQRIKLGWSIREAILLPKNGRYKIPIK